MDASAEATASGLFSADKNDNMQNWPWIGWNSVSF